MSATDPVQAVAQAIHEHDANASMSGVPWPTWDELSDDGRAAYGDVAEAAVAAARPAIEREAKVAALREAAPRYRTSRPSPSIYADLMDLADDMEAGDDAVPARPAIEREAKAAAWDEGFTRGFYDVLAGGDRDASESAAENPYRAALDGEQS